MRKVNKNNRKDISNAIVALHKLGKSKFEIGASLQISSSTVSRISKELGLKKKTKVVQPKLLRSRERYSDKLALEIQHLVKVVGHKPKAIPDKINIPSMPITTVYTLLRRARKLVALGKYTEPNLFQEVEVVGKPVKESLPSLERFVKTNEAKLKVLEICISVIFAQNLMGFELCTEAEVKPFKDKAKDMIKELGEKGWK